MTNPKTNYERRGPDTVTARRGRPVTGGDQEPLGGGHPRNGQLEGAAVAAPADQLGVGCLDVTASAHHARQPQGVDDATTSLPMLAGDAVGRRETRRVPIRGAHASFA